MDFNGPGISLFQGNELQNFESISQREEEEEALEEQRKRDIELKNMLENAFDDVSFDNEEVSLCNLSQDQLNVSHHLLQDNFIPKVDGSVFKEVSQYEGSNEYDKKSSSNYIKKFKSPTKHTNINNQVKIGDCDKNCDNYSDQCRIKIQNGALHDVVDASGGGDVAQLSLHHNHCLKISLRDDEVTCNGTTEEGAGKGKLQCSNEAHDSGEQLKILYEVRVREVHKLTGLIDSMKNEHEIEMKELQHQIALMVAERERCSVSQSQLQSLLVASKQEVEDLITNINSLKNRNNELETLKDELVMELDTAKLSINDLQRKLLVLEKGIKDHSQTVQYETNLKSLTEKHNAELMTLRKELDFYMHCNKTLTRENEDLKLKVNSLSQINDENLVKKSEVISRLSRQIDETQKQCENLMKSSTSEDIIRLQMELKILKEEKSALILKIEHLEKQNSKQEDELKQYESFNQMSSFNGDFADWKGAEASDINGKLRTELYRSLNAQKTKRQEILHLQSELEVKREQILMITRNEETLKAELSKLKEDIVRHTSESKKKDDIISQKNIENLKLENLIADVRKQMENAESNFQNTCDLLEKENVLLKKKLNESEVKNVDGTSSNCGEECTRFRNENVDKAREESEKHFRLEILKKNLEIENLKKEIEEVKNSYVEVYNSKETLLAQIEKEKNSNLASGVGVEEVKRLQKELERSRHRILELDQTLKQQYQQEVEILNLDINQLNLQVEKIKKEKDREVADKDRISVENDLLKSEIEHITSEKNLLFLKCEQLQKEIDSICKNFEKAKENSLVELNDLIGKHQLELQNVVNKYEIKIKKLKKENELNMTKNLKCEIKNAPQLKNRCNATKNVATQNSPVPVHSKSTSPIQFTSAQEKKNSSPTSEVDEGLKKSVLKQSLSSRDVTKFTDSQSSRISKKEVIDIMENLGARHEEEIKTLENQYRMELIKFEKKFEIEVNKAKQLIEQELKKKHLIELEQMEEKHRIELENRIEQEKKEAVVDLITEWAYEVQSLKVAYAEAQAEMEKTKMKYKAAKSVALQYKTYFKSKAENMKEEWRRIEDGYEKALKELEKNVHILVDVKEDEVKAKVESITKIYEQKINKMKEKLSKCEYRLKSEKVSENKNRENCVYADKFEVKRESDGLVMPNGNLYEGAPYTLITKKEKIKNLICTNEKIIDCDTKKNKLEEFAFPLKVGVVKSVEKESKSDYKCKTSEEEEKEEECRVKREIFGNGKRSNR